MESGHESPAFHVLEFFYDTNNNCALTALVNNARFHVIADADALQYRLTGSRSNTAGREYWKLLQAVKQANEHNSEADSPSDDSGVDTGRKSEASSKPAHSVHDAEHALHKWMLRPLHSTIAELTPAAKLSVKDWYTQATKFFNLELANGELCAVELEPTRDLERRMHALVPEISIPKYIRDIGVPWFHPKDLIVLDGSDLPAPYHPTRVRHDEKIYFLKLVDSSQPQPTKREIPILHKLAEKGLHDQIRVPKLEGLVAFGDHTKLLGFLQTDIPDPIPLTTKLDAEVPQHLRDQWAAEASRVSEVLHDNDIIWGDAKADNFMVDAEGQLWIIDFGGSYTEGWVDPDIQETEEGDDMGIGKITNALHDPIANTCDPGDSEVDKTAADSGGSASHATVQQPESNPHRKRKCHDDSEVLEASKSKRQRNDDCIETDETAYCYCRKPSSGNMIACDNTDCERQWFHFDCIGISQAPEQDQSWYCEYCTEN